MELTQASIMVRVSEFRKIKYRLLNRETGSVDGEFEIPTSGGVPGYQAEMNHARKYVESFHLNGHWTIERWTGSDWQGGSGMTYNWMPGKK